MNKNIEEVLRLLDGSQSSAFSSMRHPLTELVECVIARYAIIIAGVSSNTTRGKVAESNGLVVFAEVLSLLGFCKSILQQPATFGIDLVDGTTYEPDGRLFVNVETPVSLPVGKRFEVGLMFFLTATICSFHMLVHFRLFPMESLILLKRSVPILKRLRRRIQLYSLLRGSLLLSEAVS